MKKKKVKEEVRKQRDQDHKGEKKYGLKKGDGEKQIRKHEIKKKEKEKH